jgi:hypothetical protein
MIGSLINPGNAAGCSVPERIFLDLKLIERDAQTETAELVEKHVE